MKMKMKMDVIVGALLCCLSAGCGRNYVRNFIPGTYVRTVINEFSVGRDTLVIGNVNRLTYTIVHKGAYRRIKSGKLSSPKPVMENWTATFDEKKKILIEQKRGKVISFNPSENILLVGASRYKKIK